jgi:hypothetical protein
MCQFCILSTNALASQNDAWGEINLGETYPGLEDASSEVSALQETKLAVLRSGVYLLFKYLPDFMYLFIVVAT